MKIAFYAPMKPPDHPTPSGDRRMARLLMTALERTGAEVILASTLRTRDGQGDPDTQTALIAEAATEAERLATLSADLWFTYHCYYKAPDLLGPAIAKRLAIPYVIAEASRARKRLDGPWHAFATRAEAAIDAADLIFSMSATDRIALDRDRPERQRITDLPPFIDTGALPHAKRTRTGPLKLLTVAMMREGAKIESYRHLAAALAHLNTDWHLTIVGDGEARAEVEALFPSRTTFAGALDGEALAAAYAAADRFVWPGVDEAYGMVYLEAQATGLPVIAEDHPGPRGVVKGLLTPPENPAAFAAAIAQDQPDPRPAILAHHSLDRAAETLRAGLESLL